MNNQADKSEPRHPPPAPIDRLADDARVEHFPRSEDCPTEQIRENIRRWLEHNRFSTARLARMIGIGGSTLYEVLSGRYKSSPDTILRKAQAAINEWQRRQHAPAADGFVVTRIAREIFAVVRSTSKLKGIGIFTGPSGIGKTKALEAVAKRDFPSAILVTADPGCTTPLHFLRAVLRGERSRNTGFTAATARSQAWEHYRTADAFNAAVDLLAGSGRLIIVDEADNLANKILNVARQLHDATGCPVVLAGRPPLHIKIGRTMRDPNIGGSIVGRVCIEHQLQPRGQEKGGGGRWLFTVDEITQMLDQYKVTYYPDVCRWLTDLANIAALEGQREAGGLRYALKVLEMAISLHIGDILTVDMLREANTLLRGPSWEDQVDRMIEDIASRAKVAG